MAKSNRRNRSKPKQTGVEPFESDNINDDEIEDGEELDMAANKARKRRAEEDEIEDEDEVEDEDDEPTADAEADEDEEDDDEVEDEDETESEPVDLGFAPFIIHDNAEWTLEDVIDEAAPGETIYFFRPPTDDETPAKWYKLQPVEVGEK